MMPRIVKAMRLVNIEFLGLLIFLLVLNAPYCAGTFLPIHDTMFNVQAFHVFYSEWFFHGDLAHWIPYGTYGWTSGIEQLTFLSPMSYVVALAGRLLHVTDALFLFKVSVMLEQLVLLLGMYLLSRRLFSRRSTVLLVCLGAVGSTVWYAQNYFNFRIFYMFPLVVYLLLRFFETHQPAWLWFAGISSVAWALGNVPYFVALWLLTLSIVGFGFFWTDRSSWRCVLSRSWGNYTGFALLTVVAGVYLYQVAHAADFTFLASGRNSATGVTGLHPFLSYGGRADPGAILKSLVFGWPSHLPWGSTRDNSVYVGLLCMGCFFWAIFRVRTTRFLAMVSALVALVWLSFGGFFATLVYYAVPTMDHYRHIGLVYGLSKILFLLCAGFGWEHFWSARTRARTVIAALIVLGVLIDALRLAFPFDFYPLTAHGMRGLGTLFRAGSQLESEGAWATIFLWRVGIYAGLVGLAIMLARGMLLIGASVNRMPPNRMNGRVIRAALILGLLVDLTSYQAVVYAEAPKLPLSYVTYLDAMTVADWQFQEQRTTKPAGVRGQHAMSLVTRPGTMATYALAYDFAQFDPCVSAFRADWWSAGVVGLLRATSEGEWWEAKGEALARVVGCNSPKLRLVSNAVFADTIEEATDIVRATTDLDHLVVLRTTTPSGQPARLDRSGYRAEGTLIVVGFTANDLKIEAHVTSKGGAWLVYADSFHPGWKATVNGRRVPIAEAFLAFKAIWLDPGDSAVHFTFRNGGSGILSYVVAFYGMLFGLVMLGMCGRLLCHPIPL